MLLTGPLAVGCSGYQSAAGMGTPTPGLTPPDTQQQQQQQQQQQHNERTDLSYKTRAKYTQQNTRTISSIALVCVITTAALAHAN